MYVYVLVFLLFSGENGNFHIRNLSKNVMWWCNRSPTANCIYHCMCLILTQDASDNTSLFQKYDSNIFSSRKSNNPLSYKCRDLALHHQKTQRDPCEWVRSRGGQLRCTGHLVCRSVVVGQSLECTQKECRKLTDERTRFIKNHCTSTTRHRTAPLANQVRRSLMSCLIRMWLAAGVVWRGGRSVT